MTIDLFLSYLSWVLMAILYIFAGISHFTKEDFFIKIVPPFVPYPKQVVQISGVIEILLGLALLIPSLTVWAAWGIILLLIVVYPANIYMLVARIQGKRFHKLPVWGLWLRLALQFLLVYWAYTFTY